MFVYSLFFSVTQVVIPAFTCTCVGYVLSKYQFKGSDIIYTVIITTMTIPVVGTGASALKLAHDLKIYDNPIMDLITHFTGYGFNFMVMYGFFKNISWSYAEAVFIDGGSDFDAFLKVMLPQASSALITICIISFIGVWNNYERPLIYFPSYPPLAAGLYMLKKEAMNDANAPFYFAGLIVATLPLCVVYAMFSEVIFKNFSVGGLKG
jgi:ABC-type glycerol-3-phosphate transport system permease component